MQTSPRPVQKQALHGTDRAQGSFCSLRLCSSDNGGNDSVKRGPIGFVEDDTEDTVVGKERDICCVVLLDRTNIYRENTS